MIKVQKVSKYYSEVAAVSDLSFQVSDGEVLGILGPNGAGKTTTLRMLATVLEPSSGTISFLDSDRNVSARELKAMLGYLPDEPPLYRELTVFEMLQFVSKARRIARSERQDRIDEVIENCKLQNVRHQICRNLSRGFRQRVGLAQAIVHKPKVLILDEPMTGLDPKQVQEVRDLIRSVSNSCSVVLSTHALSEVSALCDRVIVIHQGCITLERELGSDSDASSVEEMFLSAVANY